MNVLAKSLDQQKECRRTDFLIDGIADEKGENWNESEKKVRQMFSINRGQ